MPPAARLGRFHILAAGLSLALVSPTAGVASDPLPGPPPAGLRVLARRSIPPRPAAAGERIRLKAGYEIDPAHGAPGLPEALKAQASTNPGGYLVYYGDADPGATRARIHAAGGQVVGYLEDHAFLVRWHAAAPPALGGASLWVGRYEPAFKLSPRLDTGSSERRMASVLLFPDAGVGAVAARLEAAGPRVVARSSDGPNRILRLEATGPELASAARDSDVAWIEPYVRPEISNDRAEWVTQTGEPDNRRVWALGLHGEGQVLMTSDTGVDVTHDQFRDPALPIPGFGDYPTHRKVIAYRSGTLAPEAHFGDHGTYHGSHTACTAVGSDDGIAGSPYDGMAKAAKLYFMDLSGPIMGAAVDPFPDLNDLFLPSYLGNAGGAARISSNSWGSPVDGDYDLNAMEVDQFTWSHPDYLAVFADGNSGAPGSVGSPASAKDVVSAGGVGNGSAAGTFYASTSRGPAADGRRKPTVCAPAQSVVSANAGPNHYLALSGTSMASPCVAGTIALMRQYCTEGWYPTGAPRAEDGFVPSAALLKAMCIGSATNQVAGHEAPDDAIGYGRIDADSVLYFAGDRRRLLLVDARSGLGHLQSIEYQLQVTDGSIPLGVTLCWSDAPGSPLAARALVNDLDLTVSGPAGTFLGNVLVHGASVSGGEADRLNVEEVARIGDPEPGLWTIRVDGADVPWGPQPFALCVTGGIGTNAGTVSLDRASYGCSAPVELRVTDTNAGPSVSVRVSSPSEPQGEIVTLAGAGGVYSGRLALSPFTGSPGDGVLQVSNGDEIVATYDDASPAATVTAHAAVRLDPPRIDGVWAAGQETGVVRVSWTTDRSATSRVYYGATPALGRASDLDPAAVIAHRIAIPGLLPGDSYFFDVESEDLDGNRTRDDNGGAHYRFTVPRGHPILLVLGEGFDQGARYADAFERLGWSYDVWSGERAAAPRLGDASGGMRSYRAIWWQAGPDAYPPLGAAARDSLARYLEGGGRLVVVGHDIAWALGAPGSPFADDGTRAWLEGTLHTTFHADATGWTDVLGVPADPITGAYAAGLPYDEHRAGASGDEIDVVAGSGSAVGDWRSAGGTPQDCGLRWESGMPLGDSQAAIWGGSASRLAACYFEWSGIDPALESSALRADVMRRTLDWLLGRARPVVTWIAPAAGSMVTGDTLEVRWAESPAPGFGIAARSLEYSPDGGQSWVVLTAPAAPGEYRWSLAGLGNSPEARLRLRVADDGSPSLAGTAEVGFVIRRANGDEHGPVVTAGSIQVSPNPIDNRRSAALSAEISDVATGGGEIGAAEWSFGDEAAAPGHGHPMTVGGAADRATADATLATGGFAPGEGRLFVRGRDRAGNWGPAAALPVVVNGDPLPAADPAALELWPSIPNPVLGTTAIRFSLPRESAARLEVFDTQGRRVRELLRGRWPAGPHQVTWDRTDSGGRRVAPGIYYYRLLADGRSLVRKLVTLR